MLKLSFYSSESESYFFSTFQITLKIMVYGVERNNAASSHEVNDFANKIIEFYKRLDSWHPGRNHLRSLKNISFDLSVD